MKELIKKRHLIPIAVWFVIYMGLFGFLEIVPPKEVHLIHCALDDMIPHMAVFIYPYVSWFPYIVVCAYLAIKNLDDRQFKKAVLVLTTGMNIFLFISFVWPTGLNLREGIVYDLHTLSGNLLKFVEIGTSVCDSAVVLLCGRVVILFSIRRFARNFKNDLDSKMRISYY